MSDGISDSRKGFLIDSKYTTCMNTGDLLIPANKGFENASCVMDLPLGTGGLKHDSSKSRVDLVPYELIEEVGRVLAFGAQKYSEGNWSKGIDQKRLIAAAIRHTYQYSNGEDTDPESGLCHLAHAACNLAFALWMRKHRPELDTRWSKENKKENK